MKCLYCVYCDICRRFLVINKDKNEKKVEEDDKKDDSIKYQYDEHYFLTDPDDFIQEFYPNKPEWQLLEQQISQQDFENLPLVRCVIEYDNPTDTRATVQWNVERKAGTAHSRPVTF